MIPGWMWGLQKRVMLGRTSRVPCPGATGPFCYRERSYGRGSWKLRRRAFESSSLHINEAGLCPDFAARRSPDLLFQPLRVL